MLLPTDQMNNPHSPCLLQCEGALASSFCYKHLHPIELTWLDVSNNWGFLRANTLSLHPEIVATICRHLGPKTKDWVLYTPLHHQHKEQLKGYICIRIVHKSWAQTLSPTFNYAFMSIDKILRNKKLHHVKLMCSLLYGVICKI